MSCEAEGFMYGLDEVEEDSYLMSRNPPRLNPILSSKTVKQPAILLC